MLRKGKARMMVKLNADYYVTDAWHEEDIGFFATGTEGFIIDISNIELIPNLTDEMHKRLIDREVWAKWRVEDLVMVNGRVVSMPVRILDYVGWYPRALCETEEDFQSLLREIRESGVKQKEGKDDVST